MNELTVTRSVVVPDILRVSRYEKAPEFGPKLLFFSGGSALADISRVLKKFTHNSTHLVTPFDSGGSSAVLRDAFDMPAIGDLRARMMALADESLTGHPEVYQLFALRLPKDAKQKDLIAALQGLVDGKDARINAITNPMRRLIRNHLQMFLDHMPDGFDLRGASIGNLILAAGYLSNNQQLDPVIFMFSKLVNVLGNVMPVVNDKLHLAVHLENGECVVGQHLITGKEVAALTSPVRDLFLVKSLTDQQPATAVLQKKKRKLIEDGDLICYPPGSFYTSLVANLLPKGVCGAIAAKRCPKVYVPSLGEDPERFGLNIDQSIFKLIDYLVKGASGSYEVKDLLNFVFIDAENGEKLKPETKKRLQKLGVRVIDTRLVTPQSAPYYDPQLLVMALLSLA